MRFSQRLFFFRIMILKPRRPMTRERPSRRSPIHKRCLHFLRVTGKKKIRFSFIFCEPFDTLVCVNVSTRHCWRSWGDEERRRRRREKSDVKQVSCACDEVSVRQNSLYILRFFSQTDGSTDVPKND